MNWQYLKRMIKEETGETPFSNEALKELYKHTEQLEINEDDYLSYVLNFEEYNLWDLIHSVDDEIYDFDVFVSNLYEMTDLGYIDTFSIIDHIGDDLLVEIEDGQYSQIKQSDIERGSYDIRDLTKVFDWLQKVSFMEHVRDALSRSALDEVFKKTLDDCVESYYWLGDSVLINKEV